MIFPGGLTAAREKATADHGVRQGEGLYHVATLTNAAIRQNSDTAFATKARAG